MKNKRIQAAGFLFVLLTMAACASAHLYGAESVNDQKAKRALEQKPPDWQQALTYYLQAHQDDKSNQERYRLIAGCLQNTGRPLAAMAWYQAYGFAMNSDSGKVETARKQVELLEVDTRAKIGALFTAAINTAEKQVYDGMYTGKKAKYSKNYFELPRLQAEAGFLAEAEATELRIKTLDLNPGTIYLASVEDMEKYGYDQETPLDRRYAYALAQAGDLPRIIAEYQKQRQLSNEHEERDIDKFPYIKEAFYLADLIQYNLDWSRNNRLARAELLIKNDPMENLDARSERILRQEDQNAIPVALGSLARTIGQTLLKVRVMPEEIRSFGVDIDSVRYATKHLNKICRGFCGSGEWYHAISDRESIRQVLQAASFFPNYGDLIMRVNDKKLGPTLWPPIALALKRNSAGTDYPVEDDIITLLTECGMGVNDPIRGAIDPKATNEDNTPLHWSAYWGNLDAVNVLLAHKADPMLKNKRGLTPLWPPA